MKIEINTYKFFNDYGFAWQFGKKWGNLTPKWLRLVAKVLWKMNGNKKMTIIKIK